MVVGAITFGMHRADHKSIRRRMQVCSNCCRDSLLGNDSLIRVLAVGAIKKQELIMLQSSCQHCRYHFFFFLDCLAVVIGSAGCDDFLNRLARRGAIRRARWCQLAAVSSSSHVLA